MWKEVTPERGEAREQELITGKHYFAPAISKGAKIVRHYDTSHSAHAILRQVFPNTPLPMKVQEEIVDQHLDPRETEAGRVLEDELMQLQRKHLEEMADLNRRLETQSEREKMELLEELEEQKQALQQVGKEMIKWHESDPDTLVQNYWNSRRDLLQSKQPF
jgi:hypothetical protein